MKAATYATSSNAIQQTKVATATSINTSGNSSGGGGGNSSSITIKAGQTLSGIAAQNNTTVSKLLAATPQIKNPNVIYAGAKISVPSGGKKK